MNTTTSVFEKRHSTRKDLTYQMEIVDTAGTDEFKTVRESSFKQKDGFIFVYDVTRLFTLRKLDDFIEQIIKYS